MRIAPYLLCGALVLQPMASPAWAGPAEEAFVSAEAGALIALLSERGASARDPSRDAVRELARAELDELVDAERVAVFSLGRYGRGLDPAQRARFVEAFRSYMTVAAVEAVSIFGRGRLEVLGSLDRRPGDSVVQTRMTPAQGDPTLMRWRVITTPAGLRVVDIEVAGVWLAIQQRNEMLAILDKNGGDVDALSDLLASRKTAMERP